MGFEPRLYRQEMNRERFRFFNIILKETDLWIGVTHSCYSAKFVRFCEEQLDNCRASLENYIIRYTEFQHSMSPIPVKSGLPPIINIMLSASASANVGPMAAVAGAVCEIIGGEIMKQYAPYELVIENGGDIYVHVAEELLVQFYAGENNHFRKLALAIPGNTHHIGICTSSGMYGHSFSYGKADSVTVVCISPTLADAWATSLCNKIKTKDDVEPVISLLKENTEVLSVIGIKDDNIGVCGQYPLTMIS